MKNINLEKLAGLLTQGLEEKVQLSADFAVYSAREANSLLLSYRGPASLEPSPHEKITLTMDKVTFHFKIRGQARYEGRREDQDCSGVRVYEQALIIPLAINQEALMRIEDVKYIEY